MAGLKQVNFRQVGLSWSMILLLGCTPAPVATTPVAPPAQPTAATPVLSPSPTQTLPIAARTQIGDSAIQLEVARTEAEKAMGLMNRTSLADDRGMLFIFEPARPVQFWMKNTLIPLDMIFLREGEVQAIIADAPPCTSDPCPTYGPGWTTTVDQVIELRAGRAAELGLKVGDRIAIEFVN